MNAGAKVRLANGACAAPGIVLEPSQVHQWDMQQRLIHQRDRTGTVFVRWADGSLRKHNMAELELIDDTPISERETPPDPLRDI